MFLTDVFDVGRDLVEVMAECARSVAGRVLGPLEPWLGGSATTAQPAAASTPTAATPASRSQERVEAAKYSAGTGPALAAVAGPLREEHGQLPAAYGVDRAVLFARDPSWVFVYWEVTPMRRVQTLRALGAEAETTREVLRVLEHRDGLPVRVLFDVELPPGADQRYVEVPRPDTGYGIEVGLRSAQGTFLSMVASNVVRTPPARPSDDTGVRWVAAAGHEHPLEPARAEWSGQRLPSPEAVLRPEASRSSETVPAR